MTQDGLPVALGLGFGAGPGVVGLCAGLTAVGLALLARFWRLSLKPIQPLAGTTPGPLA